MARILILFAHPAFQKSRINRRLLAELEGMPDVLVRDLYELYPDFHIAVERERAMLEEYDVVVFQHPFYWYSCPSLLKEWMDLVLGHGFAYGAGGDKLAGKAMLSVITAGGSEKSYQTPDGELLTNPKLLLPFHRMCRLCRMQHLAPFIVFGTHALDDHALDQYGSDYRTLMDGLAGGNFTAEAYRTISRINLLIRPQAGG